MFVVVMSRATGSAAREQAGPKVLRVILELYFASLEVFELFMELELP